VAAVLPVDFEMLVFLELQPDGSDFGVHAVTKACRGRAINRLGLASGGIDRDYRVIAAGPRQDYPPGLSARSGSWKSRFLFVLKDRHGQERYRFN
jgi:hypothetical protein